MNKPRTLSDWVNYFEEKEKQELQEICLRAAARRKLKEATKK